MVDVERIREHMDVVGSDGAHVGVVDGIEVSRIKLTRSDPAADGEHHYLHVDMVAAVGDQVHLTRTAAQPGTAKRCTAAGSRLTPSPGPSGTST